MRLWTLHPCYLDARGLVALWREALLAQAVLRGETRGYRHHPQLARFRAAPGPRAAIAAYLAEVLAEADRRGYAFDPAKVPGRRRAGPIEETDGQLRYEWEHLRRKLEERDPDRAAAMKSVGVPQPHPLFRIVAGPVRDWERLPVSEGPPYPVTPDGRYFVVRGRLWRTTNPALDPATRRRLQAELMRARSALGRARRAGDAAGRRAARQRIDAAKVALGERGPPWWTDGAPDYNRRLAANTPYRDWFDRVAREGGPLNTRRPADARR